jgi:hypothetical protein
LLLTHRKLPQSKAIAIDNDLRGALRNFGLKVGKAAGALRALIGWCEPRIKERKMANVYIEARPKGRPEGDRIDDYVVEDHADHVLGTFKTQREAIDWAKKNGHSPLVARVRHLNDKKKPDHWRAA